MFVASRVTDGDYVQCVLTLGKRNVSFGCKAKRLTVSINLVTHRHLTSHFRGPGILACLASPWAWFVCPIYIVEARVSQLMLQDAVKNRATTIENLTDDLSADLADSSSDVIEMAVHECAAIGNQWRRMVTVIRKASECDEVHDYKRLREKLEPALVSAMALYSLLLQRCEEYGLSEHAPTLKALLDDARKINGWLSTWPSMTQDALDARPDEDKEVLSDEDLARELGVTV